MCVRVFLCSVPCWCSVENVGIHSLIPCLAPASFIGMQRRSPICGVSVSEGAPCGFKGQPPRKPTILGDALPRKKTSRPFGKQQKAISSSLRLTKEHGSLVSHRFGSLGIYDSACKLS